MKKIVLILALIGATLGIAAPGASAAGCTGGGLTNIVHSPYPPPAWFNDHFQLTGCTGVDYAQVYANVGNTWIQDSAGFKAGPFQVDGLYSWANPYSKGVVSGQVHVNMEYGCWFSGVRNLIGTTVYRVHYTTGAFGPTHVFTNSWTPSSGC